MHDENTGEEPKCVICGSLEDCEHLVACIDRTFAECEGGALYDRDWEFRSEIETVFLNLLKSIKERKWQHSDLEQMWGYARTDSDIENEEVGWDGYAFSRLLIELLEDAGAIDHPGSLVVDGGPGMSSSYSLLYADKPDVVINDALKSLKLILSSEEPAQPE